MTIASMTGFARASGNHEDLSWIWEVKSVNAKGLEMRVRLPGGYEGLEIDVRRMIQKGLERGSVMASFQYQRNQAGGELTVNREALEGLVALAGEIEGQGGLAPTTVGQLLSVPGVVTPGENILDEARAEARRNAILESFSQALQALVEMRREEGALLFAPLSSLLDEIERLVQMAEASDATRPENLKARYETRVQEFISGNTGISEERLAQEVALLAAKADVREELDRLVSHVEAAREHMASGKPVGRKLDFLSQEFNREVNTMCSKSSDMELTRIGLDLKAVVAQFREQIQNIE